MLLLDAFNKDRASLPQPNAPSQAPVPTTVPDPRIQEMINEKLKIAEDLGEMFSDALSNTNRLRGPRKQSIGLLPLSIMCCFSFSLNLPVFSLRSIIHC